MIADKEQKVYETFLTRLTLALTTIPEWHEKELDLAHAWLHEHIKSISPRNDKATTMHNLQGIKFNFGSPLFTDRPSYRSGTSE